MAHSGDSIHLLSIQAIVTFISRLLGRKPELSPQLEIPLQNWQALPKTDARAPFETSRYIVVDVETSGLDPTRDSLIAIGAVAIVDGQIDMDDAFEVVLQQPAPSTHENILVHGIGGIAQATGNAPAEALLSFLTYAGNAPLVAFHAAFDETAIRLAVKKHLGSAYKPAWLDLALLAPALYPKLAAQHRTLDDWSGQFSIGNFARHRALADAYATAQLMLVLMASSKQIANARSFADLSSLEKAQRTLNRLNQ